MKFDHEYIQGFWQHYQKFLKNTLITEEANSRSSNLSSLCENNLTEAFKVFQEIELQSISALFGYTPEIDKLRKIVQLVLKNKQKIFLIGCGASGRLAMLIKRLYEEESQEKLIVCVAAGGDVSLIHSVEAFEDHAEFGIQQLIDQGYTKNDLVIGLSASGESNFILGALDYATKNSRHKPYLICNNPINIIVERNPNHIAEKKDYINILSLDVGAMALTGSTRLQATTAMQIVLYLALTKNLPFLDNTNNKTSSPLKSALQEIYNLIVNISLSKFAGITKVEADILRNKDYILYTTNNKTLGLSILADITERSPTFNLTPFENQDNLKIKDYSPSYFCLENTNNPAEVWQILFASAPTCLNWPNFEETARSYLDGFDLSDASKRKYAKYLPHTQYISSWQIENNTLKVCLKDQTYDLDLPKNLWYQSLIFKLLLNSHSTIMMGQLGFFSGNLMLSLKPSNYKLLDRAIRYAIFILKSSYHLDFSYASVANSVFSELSDLKPNESIVLKVVKSLLSSSGI